MLFVGDLEIVVIGDEIRLTFDDDVLCFAFSQNEEIKIYGSADFVETYNDSELCQIVSDFALNISSATPGRSSFAVKVHIFKN